MEDKIEKAIKTLTDKSAEDEVSAINAQQYAQAVLNLSSALIDLRHSKNK